MIDIKFIEQDVSISSFTLLDNSSYPILFLGFIIRNEYDNLRIKLNEKYVPISLIHRIKTPENDRGVCLKGIILKPNNTIKQLFTALQSQENLMMNIVTYENLLSQYSLACKETYSHFTKGLYPIDFNNLKSVCDNDFNTDKKIFQHLLNLDEKSFDFQKFSSLKLFILTV